MRNERNNAAMNGDGDKEDETRGSMNIEVTVDPVRRDEPAQYIMGMISI